MTSSSETKIYLDERLYHHEYKSQNKQHLQNFTEGF